MQSCLRQCCRCGPQCNDPGCELWLMSAERGQNKDLRYLPTNGMSSSLQSANHWRVEPNVDARKPCGSHLSPFLSLVSDHSAGARVCGSDRPLACDSITADVYSHRVVIFFMNPQQQFVSFILCLISKYEEVINNSLQMQT